ncbi:putative nuclease HARBI1 [Rhipicephalus sanguineus]|uniref:putative nuclease HARBI1 n=1 Tax=Rhipicephalus sanguineus TaxID=34632 RepID=UPI0020C256A6|nr:putative nuclease HARBI1 [Rhipicephalus sanguineus]
MAGDDNFAQFVDYVNRNEDIPNGTAYAYASPSRRTLKDRLNPMEAYDEHEFLCRYCFTKSAVKKLLAVLPLQENADGRGFPLPPLMQLLIALRFYGAGTFQLVSGDLVNVSQPTVSRVVKRISALLAETLFPVLVKFPEASQVSGVMEEFYKIGKFPGVSGCIDCTHVPIGSPGGDDAEVYRNRKGYFSISVQGITEPDLQFYDVVASWPGSAHDSRILDSSRARVMYETGAITGILLGDMGYACRSYLMTPLKDHQRGSPENRYNKSHSRTRNSVERVFGIWKRRFPCLQMTLQIDTSTSLTVITACAALHNLARMLRDPCPPDLQPQTAPSVQQPTSALPNGQLQMGTQDSDGFRTP